MEIREDIPLIESILADQKKNLGKDFIAYRNHVYRVVHFCEICLVSPLDTVDKAKIAIAGSFHDLALWPHQNMAYIEPSVAMAREFLEIIGRLEWLEEIQKMIENHHKITSCRAKDGVLVEAFRKADWIDVTLGRRNFDIPKPTLQTVFDTFPTLGFHKRLMELSFNYGFSHPLKPLPIFKL